MTVNHCVQGSVPEALFLFRLPQDHAAATVFEYFCFVAVGQPRYWHHRLAQPSQKHYFVPIPGWRLDKLNRWRNFTWQYLSARYCWKSFLSCRMSRRLDASWRPPARRWSRSVDAHELLPSMCRVMPKIFLQNSWHQLIVLSVSYIHAAFNFSVITDPCSPLPATMCSPILHHKGFQWAAASLSSHLWIKIKLDPTWVSRRQTLLYVTEL